MRGQVGTKNQHVSFTILTFALNFNHIKWFSEVINSKIKSVRLQSSSQQNLLHYFLYNRLMDYWHNMKIVKKQKERLEKNAKSGEVVVRDQHHRFVYSCNNMHVSCVLYSVIMINSHYLS